MPKISISTQKQTHFINISEEIANCIPSDFNGICNIFCTHTTGGLTINENADPAVLTDLTNDLERLIPWKNSYYTHMEGNSAAHLKSSLMGVSLNVPVQNGKMILGIWQGIYFCEFDGPRNRSVTVTMISS
ncbi:MAG: secondary thiamine-phosphate synthase enzyme YjbQ [Verrucomicrobiota bacterium]|nr:secondary thiamine-phosphate synthase enzyme YjbQ [Verrucomicrobiota bacterium]